MPSPVSACLAFMMSAPLIFRPDGTFTIVQFTDLHVTDLGEADRQTADLMRRVLDAERPDLAALTGDVIYSWDSPDPAAALRLALAPLAERRVPWAMVFGNHDDEKGITKTAMISLQRTVPGCLTEAGPEDVPGVGNFVLSVAGTSGPGASLYFLDSGTYAANPEGGKDYAWIAPEQIAWYRREAARRRGPGPVPLPALAFFHIPLPEYDDVWEIRPCRGFKYEAVCCPKRNSGFFAALKEGGDVLGTFVGHDHINDYDGDLDGIRLCYGRGTGYNTYGRDGFPRGARVIRLRQGVRAFESWLRLDDGSVVTEQPLHPPAGRVLSMP